jgi:hypothetical protein
VLTRQKARGNWHLKIELGIFNESPNASERPYLGREERQEKVGENVNIRSPNASEKPYFGREERQEKVGENINIRPGRNSVGRSTKQQQPLSAMFSDNARFEDLAANIENQETDREVLQLRTESLVPAPQQAEDEENSSQSVTEAGDGKTKKKVTTRSNGTTRAVGIDSLGFGSCGGVGGAGRGR